MPKFAFLDQVEQKINLLLSAQKYREAFSICKEYMIKYPDVEEFIRIKDKIEKYVAEENSKLVEEKLESLKPLWKAEKYSEILSNIKELLRIEPDNSKLKKLYLEAENKYKRQIANLQEEFQKKQIIRLDELLKNQPEELVEDLYILETENPGNHEIKQMVLNYRDRLIQKKIKEKSELLDSEKFEEIENFIQHLLKIDDSNERIHRLEKEINSRKYSSQIDQSKEYVYSGEKHLDTLMKLKKFDKVIQVASEVLKVDKTNATAAGFLEKATDKYNKQLKKLATESIINNYSSLKLEYAENKDKFVRI